MANKILSFFSKNNETPDFFTQLKSLLELLPCAACLIDENGDILFANRRTVSLSGFTQEELTGSNIAKYGLTLQDIHSLLENKSEDYVMKEMVTKDMEAVPMSVGAAPLADAPYG